MSNGADAARSFELSGVAAGEPTDGSRGARDRGGTDDAASDRSLGRRSGLGARHAKMDPQQSFCAAERTAMFLLCGGSTPQFSFSAVFFYHTKEYCGNSDTTQPDRFLDINTKPQVDSVPAFDVTRQTTTRSSKKPHATEFAVKNYRTIITCGAQPPHVIDREIQPTTHFEQCGIAAMRIARVARPPHVRSRPPWHFLRVTNPISATARHPTCAAGAGCPHCRQHTRTARGCPTRALTRATPVPRLVRGNAGNRHPYNTVPRRILVHR